MQDIVQNENSNDISKIYRWTVCWALPEELPFVMAASCDITSTQKGYSYPVGGASEIPFSMMSVIDNSGSRAFVNASVEKILFEGGRATGVSIKGSNIYGPHIISTIGLSETTHLLPPTVVQGSCLQKHVSRMQPCHSVFKVFITMDGTKEDLGLDHAITWHSEHQDLGTTCKKWLNKGVADALQEPLPLFCVTTNSSKDPYWERYPEHVGKSALTAMIPVNWEWFEEFKNVKGQEYKKIKKAFGNKIMEKFMDLHPLLRGHVMHTKFYTPLSHLKHLGKHKGAMYGLRLDMARFDDPGTCSAVVICLFSYV